MTRLLCMAGLLGLAFAPAPAGADAVRAAIDAANSAFVDRFLAGDAKGVSELYSEDACVIPPGASRACGRTAIAAFWAGGMKTTREVHLETATVESDGDLAFEDGVVRLVGSDGSATAERYLVVWKRVRGRWLLHRDIWNGGQPGAEP